MEDVEPRDADAGDELEAEMLRADRPVGSELHGTTPEEALEGETIDRELAQERPERPETEEVLDIVDEDLVDDEDELVGDAVTGRDPFAPPEDAALSVREDAPGAVDHLDPHGDVGEADDPLDAGQR
jgi:hypothetical protein